VRLHGGRSAQATYDRLALALHNYHQTHGYFPPDSSRVWWNWDDEWRRDPAWSAKVHLLPYMDRADIYNAANFQFGPRVPPWDYWSNNDPNQTLKQARIEVFLCPSDNHFDHAHPSATSQNYTLNTGTSRVYNNWRANGITYLPGWDWAFNKPVGIRDIIDGSSVTAAATEWIRGGMQGDFTAQRGDWLAVTWNTPDFAGGFPGGISAALRAQREGDKWYEQRCDESTSYQWDFKGEIWWWGNTGRGSGVGFTSRPNRKSCNAGWTPTDNPMTASSLHLGGVNVLFRDGRVRFVSDDVDQNVWLAVGTRVGREPVSDREVAQY
jgi:hypothetical protein